MSNVCFLVRLSIHNTFIVIDSSCFVVVIFYILWTVNFNLAVVIMMIVLGVLNGWFLVWILNFSFGAEGCIVKKSDNNRKRLMLEKMLGIRFSGENDGFASRRPSFYFCWDNIMSHWWCWEGNFSCPINLHEPLNDRWNGQRWKTSFFVINFLISLLVLLVEKLSLKLT